MLTLMTVRSFRESNLDLPLACLKEAVPMCFALDHTNYARWLSVFIQDLQVLKVENPDLYKTLEVNLGVQTTNAGF